MRTRTTRLLATVAAAVVVSLAVPAYAAGVLADGGGLAAGVALAGGCDHDGVATAYSLAPGENGFVVAAVDVEGIAAACAGGEVQVELRAADGSTIGGGATRVARTEATVALAVLPAASDVAAVHVVLTGRT